MKAAIADATFAPLLAGVEFGYAEERAAAERYKSALDQVTAYLAVCFGPPGILVAALPEWPVDTGHPNLARISNTARHDGCWQSTVYRRYDVYGVGKPYSCGMCVSITRNEA